MVWKKPASLLVLFLLTVSAIPSFASPYPAQEGNPEFTHQYIIYPHFEPNLNNNTDVLSTPPTDEDLEIDESMGLGFLPNQTSLDFQTWEEAFETINSWEYLPYYGFMKGVAVTAATQQGNDADLSLALLYSLRRLGIPSRLVRVTVSLSSSEVTSLLMVNTLERAYEVLINAGIPASIQGNNLLVERFVVAAWIDGKWKLLDPSYKGYTITQNHTALDFMELEHVEEELNSTIINERYGWVDDELVAEKVNQLMEELNSTLLEQVQNYETLGEMFWNYSLAWRGEVETHPEVAAFLGEFTTPPVEDTFRFSISYYNASYSTTLPSLGFKAIMVAPLAVNNISALLLAMAPFSGVDPDLTEMFPLIMVDYDLKAYGSAALLNSTDELEVSTYIPHLGWVNRTRTLNLGDTFVVLPFFYSPNFELIDVVGGRWSTINSYEMNTYGSLLPFEKLSFYHLMGLTYWYLLDSQYFLASRTSHVRYVRLPSFLFIGDYHHYSAGNLTYLGVSMDLLTDLYYRYEIGEPKGLISDFDLSTGFSMLSAEENLVGIEEAVGPQEIFLNLTKAGNRIYRLVPENASDVDDLPILDSLKEGVKEALQAGCTVFVPEGHLDLAGFKLSAALIEKDGKLKVISSLGGDQSLGSGIVVGGAAASAMCARTTSINIPKRSNVWNRASNMIDKGVTFAGYLNTLLKEGAKAGKTISIELLKAELRNLYPKLVRNLYQWGSIAASTNNKYAFLKYQQYRKILNVIDDFLAGKTDVSPRIVSSSLKFFQKTENFMKKAGKAMNVVAGVWGTAQFFFGKDVETKASGIRNLLGVGLSILIDKAGWLKTAPAGAGLLLTAELEIMKYAVKKAAETGADAYIERTNALFEQYDTVMTMYNNRMKMLRNKIIQMIKDGASLDDINLMITNDFLSGGMSRILDNYRDVYQENERRARLGIFSWSGHIDMPWTADDLMIRGANSLKRFAKLMKEKYDAAGQDPSVFDPPPKGGGAGNCKGDHYPNNYDPSRYGTHGGRTLPTPGGDYADDRYDLPYYEALSTPANSAVRNRLAFISKVATPLGKAEAMAFDALTSLSEAMMSASSPEDIVPYVEEYIGKVLAGIAQVGSGVPFIGTPAEPYIKDAIPFIPVPLLQEVGGEEKVVMYRPTVAVIKAGFYKGTVNFLSDVLGIPYELIPLGDRRIGTDEFNEQFKLIIVPPGALTYAFSRLPYGKSRPSQLLDNDYAREIRERFESFVESGGKVLAFSQPIGALFGLLPGTIWVYDPANFTRAVPLSTEQYMHNEIPEGYAVGELQAFGWTQDQSCKTASVRIANYGPMLYGLTEMKPDLFMDGLFVNVPPYSTVDFVRTANGMPAMLHYSYGNGTVIMLTSVDLWSWSANQWISSDAREFLSNLITWLALDPAEFEGKVQQNIHIQVSLENPTDHEIDKVVLKFWRSGISEPKDVEVDQVIPPHGTSDLEADVSFQRPGLWIADAELYSGDEKVYTAMDVARILVRKFDSVEGGLTTDSAVLVSLSSDRELYMPGETVNMTITIVNNLDQDANVSLIWISPHKYAWTPHYNYTLVPAHSIGEVMVSMPDVREFDRFRIRYFVQDTDISGYLTKGIWVIEHPEVSIDILADANTTYLDGRLPVEVNITNPHPIPFNPDLLIQVIDPLNNIVLSEFKAEVAVPAEDTITYSHEFTGLLGLEEHHYLISASLLMGSETYIYWGRELHGRFVVAKASTTIRPYIGIGAFFDKPEYSLGENATLTVKLDRSVANDLQVRVWSDETGYDETKVLRAGDTQVSFLVPVQYDSPGSKLVNYSITLGAKTLTSNITLTLGKPKVVITNFGPGSATLRNEGSFPATGNLTVEIKGNGLHWSHTFEGITLGIGEEATYSAQLPEDIKDGNYRVGATWRGLYSSDFAFTKVHIVGLTGLLQVSTDQEAYPTGSSPEASISSHIQGGSLDNGTLVLKLYSSGLLMEAVNVTDRSDEDIVRIDSSHASIAVNRDDGRFALAARPIEGDTLLKIMYGWPSPWSSFTTIRLMTIDGETHDYVFGTGGFISVERRNLTKEELATLSQEIPLLSQEPYISGASVICAWSPPGYDVTVWQKLTIVYSATMNPDTILISYTVLNDDPDVQDVKLRVMIDTQLASNDGAPFRLPNGANVTKEVEFMGDDIPEFFQTMDSLENPTIVAQATIRGFPIDPYRFVIANWGRIENTVFDFNINPDQSVTGDSAFALYYDLGQSLGENRTVSFFYGIGNPELIGVETGKGARPMLGGLRWATTLDYSEGTINVDLPQLNAPGRYVLTAEVFNSEGQSIVWNYTDFYVSAGNVVASITTDKLHYWIGDEATISGTVYNLYDAPIGTTLKLYLNDTLVREWNLDLPARGTFDYSYSMVADAIYIARVEVEDPNAEAFNATTTIFAEEPRLNLFVEAPLQAGATPITVNGTLENPTYGDITTRVTFLGEDIGELRVPARDVVKISRNLFLYEDGTFTLEAEGFGTASAFTLYNVSADVVHWFEEPPVAGTVRVWFNVTNYGLPTDFLLELTIDGVNATKVLHLDSGGSATFFLAVPLSGGLHTASYRLISQPNGDTVYEDTFPVAVGTGAPDLISGPTGIYEVDAGSFLELNFTAFNYGDQGGTLPIDLNMPGIFVGTISRPVAPGLNEVSIPIYIPADMDERNITSAWSSGDEEGTFTVAVKGPRVSATPWLDKPVYRPGEQIHASIEVENLSPVDRAFNVSISYAGQSVMLTAEIPAGQTHIYTANFEAIDHTSRVTYIVSLPETGMNLYINSTTAFVNPLPEECPAVWPSTDRVDLGDEFSLFFDLPNEMNVTITFLGVYNETIILDPGLNEVTIPVNGLIATGIYDVQFSVWNDTAECMGSYPIAVNGVRVRIANDTVTDTVYLGEELSLTLWLQSTHELQATLVFYFYDEDGILQYTYRAPIEVEQGLGVYEIRVPIPEQIPTGYYTMEYQLFADLPGMSPTMLAYSGYLVNVLEERARYYTLTLETPHANAYGAGEYEEGMQAEFWVEPTQITQGHYTYVAYGYLLDGVFHEGTHGTVTMNADHHVEFLWRTYVDEVELQLLRRRDRPMRRLWLTLEFEDGTQITARTDRQGRIRLEDVPLGKVEMGFTYRRIPYRISFYLEDYGEQQVKLNIGRGYLRVRPERMRARIGIWFNGTGFTLFFMDGSSMYWPIIEQHEDRRYTYYTVQTEWGELTIKARRNYLFYGRTHELYFRARLI